MIMKKTICLVATVVFASVTLQGCEKAEKMIKHKVSEVNSKDEEFVLKPGQYHTFAFETQAVEYDDGYKFYLDFEFIHFSGPNATIALLSKDEYNRFQDTKALPVAKPRFSNGIWRNKRKSFKESRYLNSGVFSSRSSSINQYYLVVINDGGVRGLDLKFKIEISVRREANLKK